MSGSVHGGRKPGENLNLNSKRKLWRKTTTISYQGPEVEFPCETLWVVVWAQKQILEKIPFCPNHTSTSVHNRRSCRGQDSQEVDMRWVAHPIETWKWSIQPPTLYSILHRENEIKKKRKKNYLRKIISGLGLISCPFRSSLPLNRFEVGHQAAVRGYLLLSGSTHTGRLVLSLQWWKRQDASTVRCGPGGFTSTGHRLFVGWAYRKGEEIQRFDWLNSDNVTFWFLGLWKAVRLRTKPSNCTS